MAAYPIAADGRQISGRAAMSCVVDQGRLSDCKIVAEEPARAGFGFALLNLAPKFQMAEHFADGAPTQGVKLTIPIRFGAGPAERELVWPKRSTGYMDFAPVGPYYPERAARMGLQGLAEIECHVAASRRLIGCRPVAESPREAGFAEASLRMAEMGWMEAAPLAGGAPEDPDRSYVFTVAFRIRGRSR